MGKLFGEFIKKLREDRKLTLRDVENQVKVSNAYLSQVERGERGTPTMKILMKLAKVYGIPVSVLSDKAEEEFKNNLFPYTLHEVLKGKKTSDLPSPDTEFICRGYEKLSEEKKRSLKDFLQYLQKDNKKQ